MENKDLVPAETTNISEATPLVQEGKKDVEGRDSSLTKLASELSDLTLEIGGKVTSTSPVDAATADPQDTAIQVSSNSEGEGRSGASTDVEESETAVAGETSEPPTADPQEMNENESPRSSSSADPVIGGRNRLFDRTTFLIIWEILLLGFPISETYYAVKFVRGCDAGDKLPLLLILVAFITSLTLLGRILINVTRKLSLYDESNDELRSFPSLAIIVGDVITGFLVLAEVAYYISIDKENCNKEFREYVLYANCIGMAVIVSSCILNRCVFIRIFNTLRQF